MSNLVKRLNDTLPSISTPMMKGDNLAIVLCTAFDDGQEETADDNGWSIAARNGYEEVIAAIRDHYKPAADTIAALTARVEELEAAHKAIMELPGEINTGNYTHDDVVALNNAFCEAFHISSAAITKGESND